MTQVPVYKVTTKDGVPFTGFYRSEEAAEKVVKCLENLGAVIKEIGVLETELDKFYFLDNDSESDVNENTDEVSF